MIPLCHPHHSNLYLSWKLHSLAYTSCDPNLTVPHPSHLTVPHPSRPTVPHPLIPPAIPTTLSKCSSSLIPLMRRNSLVNQANFFFFVLVAHAFVTVSPYPNVALVTSPLMRRNSLVNQANFFFFW